WRWGWRGSEPKELSRKYFVGQIANPAAVGPDWQSGPRNHSWTPPWHREPQSSCRAPWRCPSGSSREIADAEVLALVHPDALRGKAAGLGQAAQVAQVELVRVLGANRLARSEADFDLANMGPLVAPAHQMHFDPSLDGVIEGPVREAPDHEVGA